MVIAAGAAAVSATVSSSSSAVHTRTAAGHPTRRGGFHFGARRRAAPVGQPGDVRGRVRRTALLATFAPAVSAERDAVTPR
nr:TPA_asm: m68.6-m73.5 ORF [Murid betaherpesvirus 1]DBA07803.1 TPA_asm: m68.6-m73.5 ORF [Murid betaherpesvirus 1]